MPVRAFRQSNVHGARDVFEERLDGGVETVKIQSDTVQVAFVAAAPSLAHQELCTLRNPVDVPKKLGDASSQGQIDTAFTFHNEDPSALIRSQRLSDASSTAIKSTEISLSSPVTAATACR